MAAKVQSSPNFQLLVASANLFIAAAGAGLLSYPYAVRSQGIALNIILSIAFAAINAYTDLVLAATAFRVRRWLVALTYEEICLRVLGPWGYVGAVTTVIVGCLGVLVGFMVITADLAQPVILELCSGSSAAACDVVSHRAFVLLVFAVGVALPFSSCERMHGLVASSAVAAITVIAVAVIVVAKGAEAMVSRGQVCAGENAPLSPYVDGSTVWFNLSTQVRCRFCAHGRMLPNNLHDIDAGNLGGTAYCVCPRQPHTGEWCFLLGKGVVSRAPRHGCTHPPRVSITGTKCLLGARAHGQDGASPAQLCGCLV